MPDPATSPSLLRLLADGGDNAIAWYEFHSRYTGFLHGVLIARGVQPADREDIIQEVMLAVFRAVPDFRYDQTLGRFRSYLKASVIRSLANRSHSKAKQRSRELASSTRSVPDDFDQIWEREWRQHHTRLALVRLDAQINDLERGVFDAYAVRCQDAQSVASEFEIPVDRVYRIKSELLTRLELILSQQMMTDG